VNTLLKGYAEVFLKYWILPRHQPLTVTIEDVCERWVPRGLRQVILGYYVILIGTNTSQNGNIVA